MLYNLSNMHNFQLTIYQKRNIIKGRIQKLFNVEFYTMPNGHKPIEEFLDGLDIKMRNKALDSLMILKEKGNTLREPYSKPMKNGLFELRIKFSKDISRIFYFFITGKKIILTNGFVKKTQKTPYYELETALKYKADYERRCNYGRSK